MDALLIVDVTTNEDWKPTLADMSPKMRAVAQQILDVLTLWRSKNGLVCMVTYPSRRPQKKHTQFRPDTNPLCIGCDSLFAPLAHFLGHRHGPSFEPVFLKSTPNAFDHPVLTHHLYAKGVTRVFLAGCQTSDCILQTAIGAVRHGFSAALYDRCTFPAFSGAEDRFAWLDTVQEHAEIGATVELL